MSYNIPLIDFSKCGLLVTEDDVTKDDLRETGEELYAALSNAGFAYLTNHGISWSMVDDLNQVAEGFFSLPLDEKKSFEGKSIALSYDSIGRSKANLKEADNYEGLRAGGEGLTSGYLRWPDVPGLKENFVQFSETSRKLLMRLMRALGYGMKLKDVDYFCKAHSLINQKGNFTVLKAIKYPPIDDDDMATENRIGEHTDKDSMTLLFQDEMGGLQVRETITGEFIDVPPIPGSIVINIGDTLAAWSGNRLKATLHRANAPSNPDNRGNIRRSVGYFGQADNHVLMKRLIFEDDVDDDEKGEDEKPMMVEQYSKIALGAIFSEKF